MKRIFLTVLAIMALCCLFAINISAEATECGHNTYDNGVVTKDPTCQAQGQVLYTCTTCGQTKTEAINTIDHFYRNVSIVAPTCTADGSITYTCSMCNGTKTEVVTARHTYHATVDIVADCYNKGQISFKCDCGATDTPKVTDYVHKFTTQVTVEPTHDTEGVLTKTCSVCNTVETEAIPVKHDKTMVTAMTAPSCFYAGSITYYCSLCQESITETIEATHSYESEVTTPATCTTNGVLRHTCQYCKYSHTDIIVAKHTYDVLNGTPTSIVYTDYTQTGVKYFTCDNCDATEGVIANPVFIFLGYSATEYNVETAPLVEITCGYNVDVDALQLLQEVWAKNNKTFEYGIVGAVESHLGENEAPLVSETAEPVVVATSNNSFIVKKIKLAKNNYASVEGKLINIDYTNHATYFYLSLYIFDGEKTVYISDDSCRDIPLPISYAMLVDGDEDHDNVSKNNVSFGNGITYSTIEGTVPTQARLDLIANSAKDYKSEEATQDSVRDEDTVASIGGLGSWAGTVPNANELLNYYLELGGDATHFHNLDVQSLITENNVAKKSWQTSINNILRAAELMAIQGETVNIDQTTETQVQLTSSNSLWSSNRDWYLSFIDGFYYTDTDLNNLTVTTDENGVKTYTAQIVYTVIDYYSFYPYKDDTSTSSFLLWGPTKKELAQLHLDGNALDFLIESSITYNVSWTEGQRAANDGTLNTYTDLIEVNETVDSSILTVVTE